MVYVPLWENPKVLIEVKKSLDMSKNPKSEKDLGGFNLGIYKIISGRY